MERSRPSSADFSGERLTLADLGVDSADTGVTKPEAEPETKKSNIVEINSYRQPSQIEEIKKDQDSKERNKKIKALMLSGAALLGSGKLVQEAFAEKIKPAQRIETLNELENATNIEIEGIELGSKLEVSAFSYTVTGGNVRTSPKVETASGEPDTNLVHNLDLSGKVLTHPIEVADETNPANGNWFVFFDSEGQKFAVNGDNLNLIDGSKVGESSEIEVSVDKTTNMGIIAHDKNNVSMQVATVVE